MARVQIFFEGPSLTRQEFKDETDLGKIIARFAKTAEGAQALKNAQGHLLESRFDDVTSIPDFRMHRDMINRAEASFMALPAIVRRRFNNDSAEFLDFAADPGNLEELRILGLAKPAQRDAAIDPLLKASS